MKSLAVAVLLGLLLSGMQRSRAEQADPWASLKFRTAWVLAGLVDDNEFDDMLVTQPVLRRPNQREAHRFRLVEVGDVVSVINPTPLLLRDFKKVGERDRDVCPARPQILEEDETGLRLPPGSLVKVLRFERMPPTKDGLRSIYAQVVPAK